MSRRWITVVLILGLLMFGSVVRFQQPALAAPAADVQVQTSVPRTVYVNLFEWRWADVARECETYLGPKGFAAVQVSPPHEHLHLASQGYPWWERYQVIGYAINSRSGDRAAFQNMVQRCNAVGVDIYVDAIVNHTAGTWPAGTPSISGNTSWSHYNYPGTYSSNDFHYCGTPGNEITNYGDRWNVQNCELSDLADLKTEDTYVRNRIRTYLSDLLSLGVDGFRIDAAKHIPPADLQAILSGLTRTPEGTAPYVVQEVIEASGEPIQGSEYFATGDVNEFQYGSEMYRIFNSGNVAEVNGFNDSKPGFMPSIYASVFTDNHDKQRGHGGGGSYLTYKDGAKYAAANVLMLAWPYGYSQLMSSYAFTDTNAGPPGSGGVTRAIYDSPTDTTPDCFGDWVCEHRWTAMGNMVAFRNYTNRNFYVSDWWTNGYDAVAFGRGNAGYVVVNGESFAINRTFQTSMPAGTYCNVTDGELNASKTGCTGTTITVDANGRFTANVNAMSAIAIHDGQKVQGGGGGTSTVTFKVNATTYWGQNVYVVGNQAALGNWNPCNGVKMSAATYPVWSQTITLPANTPIEFKFVKWEGTCQNVQWESAIGNRKLTTPTGGGSMTTPTYNWNVP